MKLKQMNQQCKNIWTYHAQLTRCSAYRLLVEPIQFKLYVAGLHSRNTAFAFLKNDRMSCLYPTNNFSRFELSFYAKTFFFTAKESGQ